MSARQILLQILQQAHEAGQRGEDADLPAMMRRFADAGLLSEEPPPVALPPIPHDDRQWRLGTHYGIHLYAVNRDGEDEPLGTMLAPEFARQVVYEHQAALDRFQVGLARTRRYYQETDLSEEMKQGTVER